MGWELSLSPESNPESHAGEGGLPKAGSLRSRAALGVRWNAGSLGTALVLQIVQTAVLARLLPPAEFGLLGIVLAVTGLAQALSDFGLGNAIVFRQNLDPGELSSLFWANALAGIGSFLLAIIAAPGVAAWYGVAELRGLLTVAGAVFCIAPLGQAHQALLQRDLHFRGLFICETAGALAGAATALAAGFILHNAYALVLGPLASGIVRTSSLWLVSSWRPSMRLRKSDLRPHMSFGLHVTGQRLVNALMQNADKLIIGKALGNVALGHYTMASQLMLRPMLLLNPIVTRVAFPVFARMQNEAARLREGYLEVIRLVSSIMMPLYLLMFAVSGPLVRVLLGPGWGAAESVFRILVFLGLLYSLGNPSDSLLQAMGRARTAFWFNVLAFFVYVGAVTAGTRYGLHGVAWALLISCLAVLVPIDALIRRRSVGMTFTEYALAFLPFLAMGAAAAAAVAAAQPYLADLGDQASLLLSAALGGAIYIAAAAVCAKPFLIRARSLLAGGT
jgi:lipopolysaccharide exporter